MKAHDVAYKLIFDWAKDTERPLTEQNIKKLNEIILVRPYWKEAQTNDGQDTRRQIRVGDHKQFPNSVRLANGEMFHYTSPTNTPIEMQELINWYREEENKIHPVTLAAMLHYKFVCIHPFDDGNGRISRLLVNYVLLKNGFPPIIIRSSDKQNYLRALHQADVGDIEAFINYIGEQVIWALEICIRAGKGENIEEKNDWEKELQLIKKSVGQISNTKIESRYSTENIKEIFIKTILPLLSKWDQRIEEFESLFYYTECKINWMIDQDNPFGLTRIDTHKFSEAIPSLQDLFSTDILRDITLLCKYRTLRSSAVVDIFSGGEIEFSFHDNAYEVRAENNISKSLFYKQFLEKEELDHFIDQFPKSLVNQIRSVTS